MRGCLTPKQENGVCISIKKCEELNDLLMNRRHENSIRIFLQKSFCGYDYKSGLPKLCCPIEQKSDQSRNQQTSIIADKSIQFLLSSILPPTCGKIMINSNSHRIIGGYIAKLGEKNEITNLNLISEFWVL